MGEVIGLQTRDKAFVVDLDGFEGPLDLLLALARTEKVDIAKMSVLALVEQYLAFIETLRERRIEIASDYLVMAAWLAYLKARLLVPKQARDDEPDGEELAAILAERLQRLEAMRVAARHLAERPRLGRDILARGQPEAIRDHRIARYEASLVDLLRAYAEQRRLRGAARVEMAPRRVWSLTEMYECLERLVGKAAGWTPLQTLLDHAGPGDDREGRLAAGFSASLELVREGRAELRQAGPFERLDLRTRQGRDGQGPEDDGREGGADERRR
ncbi:MAG: segregation/condensation protein A [Hyphomicrobiaceae bacterium]|nr:segregation/condensation protein A [Hyphomicrobiaceae bacterium]